MNEFLAPINYDRARDVLWRLQDYTCYTPDGAQQVRQTLEECYPLIFSRMEARTFDRDALLLQLPGANVTEPLVFASHLDVPDVPAETPVPGTVQMPLYVPLSRAHVVALMEALEELLRDGYCPGGDLILALSMDGLSGGAGARSMAEHLRARSINPCFVLDHGGYTTMDAFRNFLPKGAPLALIGIAEKAMQDIRLTAYDDRGMAALLKTARKTKCRPVRISLCTASEKMLSRLGRQAPLLYSLLLRKPALTFPLIRLRWRGRSVMQQFFTSRRSLCSLEMHGTPDMPAQEAELVIRQLVAPGAKSGRAQLERFCKRNGIVMEVTQDYAQGQESDTTGEALDALETAVEIQFERSVIVPCLCPMITDSRFYTQLSSRVYRLSPFMVTGEEALKGLCTVTDGALQTAVQFFRSMLSV